MVVPEETAVSMKTESDDNVKPLLLLILVMMMLLLLLILMITTRTMIMSVTATSIPTSTPTASYGQACGRVPACQLPLVVLLLRLFTNDQILPG